MKLKILSKSFTTLSPYSLFNLKVKENIVVTEIPILQLQWYFFCLCKLHNIEIKDVA